jgi:hypothetical protein
VNRLASAEVITREEYERVRTAKPGLGISAKYIVTEVKPTSAQGVRRKEAQSPQQVQPTEPTKPREVIVIEAVEQTALLGIDQSQAATRPETSSKPSTGKRKVRGRSVTVSIPRPIKSSNFIVDRLERSLKKKSQHAKQAPQDNKQVLDKEKQRDLKLRTDTELLERYQLAVSTSPHANWHAVMSGL